MSAELTASEDHAVEEFEEVLKHLTRTSAPAAEALVKEILRLGGNFSSPHQDEMVLAAKNYLGQYAAMEFTLTALQASALRNASERLMEGDLEGAKGQLQHVALYPILRREDDLSIFVQTLHAYVKKLIETFRCCS